MNNFAPVQASKLITQGKLIHRNFKISRLRKQLLKIYFDQQEGLTWIHAIN